MLSNSRTPRVVWRVKDSKPGHENQTRGLVDALAKLRPIQVFDITVKQGGTAWFAYLTGQHPDLKRAEKPHLLLGAGSRTHLTLLAAAKQTGAPAVVLMAPPKYLVKRFDLCIVPEHDSQTGANIVTTKGALNTIHPSTEKPPKQGLFLIGGPSKHHLWDAHQVRTCIGSILNKTPEVDWIATTSRRSPVKMVETLYEIGAKNFNVIPVEKTDAAWLPEQLARASYVWVTEDSVSMVYEALSSGANVGLLPVPRKNRSSRVLLGVDQLASSGHVLPYDPSVCDLKEFTSQPPLNEADRIAQLIDTRFFGP